MAHIQLKHVCKRYENGFEAVKDFNLEIQDNEFIIFVGPSGCGKSTTLRMLAGLENISEGELYIDGERMNEVEACDRDIAMVFQNYALYPHMSVRKNIGYSLHIRHEKKEVIEAKVNEAAEILGLTEVLDRKPSELSGGQKQRVAIARALANDPKVLLCDEATSALDPQTTSSILKLLKEVNQKLGITIVLITHEMAVIKEICNRVAVMELGKVVETGNILDIFSHPKAQMTIDFINSTNPITKIYELIDNGAEIVRLHKGQRLLKLTYGAEETKEALISQLSKKYDVVCNIVFGNVEVIQQAALGSLIVMLEGSEDAMRKAEAELKHYNIEVEVLKCWNN